MPIIFFHQNEVVGVQGGVERYLSCLLATAKETSVLVTEGGPNQVGSRIAVPMPLVNSVPKWMSYSLGVYLHAGRIRRAIKQFDKTTLEFSRPEYALFSWMFQGTKVFTLHGTGPLRSERLKYVIHRLCCFLLPFSADLLQVVGRDTGALPPVVKSRMQHRIRYVDAWYDECFKVSPFPDTEGPLRVFYAGRITLQKNPGLLFSIIEHCSKEWGGAIEFRYMGSNEDKIPDLVRRNVKCLGLLNAEELATAIADCHVGILCSTSEGSPFIVIETIACGRCFVLPPLPNLLETYDHFPGVFFADDYTLQSFVLKLIEAQAAIKNGMTPEDIHGRISHRSQAVAATALAKLLEDDSHR